MRIEQNNLPESSYAGNGSSFPDPTATYDQYQQKPIADTVSRVYFAFDFGFGFDTTLRVTANANTIVREDATEKKFDELIKAWKAETAHLSLVRQQTASMSFLKLLTLGERALPYIFAEFEKRPAASWVVALEVITEANPALNAPDYRTAVKNWLDWGKTNGYR